MNPIEVSLIYCIQSSKPARTTQWDVISKNKLRPLRQCLWITKMRGFNSEESPNMEGTGRFCLSSVKIKKKILVWTGQGLNEFQAVSAVLQALGWTLSFRGLRSILGIPGYGSQAVVWASDGLGRAQKAAPSFPRGLQ